MTKYESKFRAWDLDRGKMHYNTDHVVVMQFTGMIDSNGKEIYEGDIVRWDDASKGEYWKVAKVIREIGHFAFKTIPELCINCYKSGVYSFEMGDFAYCPNTSAHGNVMEVIGNIYETPIAPTSPKQEEPPR